MARQCLCFKAAVRQGVKNLLTLTEIKGKRVRRLPFFINYPDYSEPTLKTLRVSEHSLHISSSICLVLNSYKLS